MRDYARLRDDYARLRDDYAQAARSARSTTRPLRDHYATTTRDYVHYAHYVQC